MTVLRPEKKTRLGADVFTMAYDRLYQEYAAGHRVVVAVSGGKDSTIVTELAIMAARDAGRLPVEVATRDEEIMYPGTFEYLERIAERPEVDFHWYIAHMPIVNSFSRKTPLWWTFDTELEPEQWVRIPPSWHEVIPQQHIANMIMADRFPVGPGTVGVDGLAGFEGQRLYTALGLRASESPQRLLGIHSAAKAQGYKNPHLVGFSNTTGSHGIRPVYDWEDSDVWKFIADNQFDYNHAYDVMLRMGTPRRNMRIAPPTMRAAAMKGLRRMAGAWPKWFDKVCQRVDGIRTAVQYGDRATTPERRLGESWEDVFKRTILDPSVPAWLRERGELYIEKRLAVHAQHSTGPWPDAVACPICSAGVHQQG